jgi:uncharacterized membrane protein YeaQ/YmgE (transglycosylase-associated protein family)
MGLVFLLVFGAILGWLAAIVMRADDRRGVTINMLLGIGGALFAGLVVHPWMNGGSLLAGRYGVDGLLTAVVGSLAVLLVANVLRSNRELRPQRRSRVQERSTGRTNRSGPTQKGE